ncbi:hypothetical protein [Paludifilum halophilum]|uniref:hypothetical protein n=1 Tax=Paludifilum halophilum TaxID=1642702 RepID=UPI00146E3535|nr:hypothetical protein [Paludifilum halophilum]
MKEAGVSDLLESTRTVSFRVRDPAHALGEGVTAEEREPGIIQTHLEEEAVP